jgi:hypothetical protein
MMYAGPKRWRGDTVAERLQVERYSLRRDAEDRCPYPNIRDFHNRPVATPSIRWGLVIGTAAALAILASLAILFADYARRIAR